MNVNTNTNTLKLTKFERRTLENARKIIGAIAGAFDMFGRSPVIPKRAAESLEETLSALDGAEADDEDPLS